MGFTAGLNTVLVPVYLSEIAPVSLRGGIGVLNQLAVTLGIFIGQVPYPVDLGNFDLWYRLFSFWHEGLINNSD